MTVRQQQQVNVFSWTMSCWENTNSYYSYDTEHQGVRFGTFSLLLSVQELKQPLFEYPYTDPDTEHKAQLFPNGTRGFRMLLLGFNRASITHIWQDLHSLTYMKYCSLRVWSGPIVELYSARLMSPGAFRNIVSILSVLVLLVLILAVSTHTCTRSKGHLKLLVQIKTKYTLLRR